MNAVFRFVSRKISVYLIARDKIAIEIRDQLGRRGSEAFGISRPTPPLTSAPTFFRVESPPLPAAFAWKNLTEFSLVDGLFGVVMDESGRPGHAPSAAACSEGPSR